MEVSVKKEHGGGLSPVVVGEFHKPEVNRNKPNLLHKSLVIGTVL